MEKEKIKIHQFKNKNYAYTRIVLDLTRRLNVMFGKMEINPNEIEAVKEWDMKNKKVIITFKEKK